MTGSLFSRFLGQRSTASMVIELGQGSKPSTATNAKRLELVPSAGQTSSVPLSSAAHGNQSAKPPGSGVVVQKKSTAATFDALPEGIRMYGCGTKLRPRETRLGEENKTMLGAIIHDDDTATILLTEESSACAMVERSFVGDLGRAFAIRGQVSVSLPVLASAYSHYAHEAESQQARAQDAKATKGQAIALGHDIIRSGIEIDASDIHVEIRNKGGERSVEVRMRVDGEMVQHMHYETPNMVKLTDTMVSALFQSEYTDESSRSDSAASNQISQRALTRIPELKNVSLRFQTILDNNGYDLVLRILGYDGKNLTQRGLSSLGFEADHVRMLENAMAMPYGLTLIMGPTGAGKTSTIASALYADPLKKVRKRYSLEDPVEINQPDLTSSYVQHSDTDLTQNGWLVGLKAFLRGDPDFIMLGEIRDQETASIAVEGALTGHNMWGTLHINSIFRTFDRLTGDKIQIDPTVLAGDDFINALAVQRLVQRLCDVCKVPYADAIKQGLVPQSQVRTLTGYEGMADAEGRPLQSLFVRNGSNNTCAECKGKGIKGRSVIAEVTQLDYLDPELRQRLIQEKRFGELEIAYWRSRKTAYNDPDMSGKTIRGHALLRASRGEICASGLFATFPDLERALKKAQLLKVDRLAERA